MAWVTVAVIGGSALLGGLANEKKAKRIAALNEAEAEKTRWSPWTGMKGDLQDPGGGFGDGALQGAMGGAMMSQQFGSKSTVPTEKTTSSEKVIKPEDAFKVPGQGPLAAYENPERSWWDIMTGSNIGRR